MKVVMLLGNKNSDIKKRVQVVASSGNLSRANGTVTEVIKKNSSYESNLKLARIVVGYGHKSISEHDYLVFAIENVTPIVEQILISYRLTSFTIKSRRNVDFRNVGFYVPIFMDKDSNVLSNNKKLQNKYKKYMKDLFLKYGRICLYIILLFVSFVVFLIRCSKSLLYNSNRLSKVMAGSC